MSVPRYRQIADDLRARITAGEYAVGDRLPSLLALQRQFDVPGINTVRHALRVLAEQGLVRTDPGRGTFVIAAQYPGADREDLLAALRQARETVDRAIAYLEHSPTPADDHRAEPATTPAPRAAGSTPPAADTATRSAGALLKAIAEATGATPPDADLWPDTVKALATRRNRAAALARHGPDGVEVSLMRRGRRRDAGYTIDAVKTYAPRDAATAVHDIRRYLTPR